MKTGIMMRSVLYICIVLLLISCNKESTFYVSEEVESTFNSMYPDAQSLEWEMIDGYVVGEFRNEGYYCKAWFHSDGKWLMTETSDLNYDKLSSIIRHNFELRYSTKYIEDVYKVEFSSIEARYVIEIEVDNISSYLFYIKSGEFFKQVDGSWNNRPIVIHQEILNYIYSNHENSYIIDATMYSYPIKIRINDKNIDRIVCFNSPTQWLATYWDVAESDVSSPAQKKLTQLLQTGDKVTKIYKMLYFEVEEKIYVFEINNGSDILFIKDDGTQVEIDNNFL